MSRRRSPETDDTAPDERIGPRSKCLASCPTCGVMLIAPTPTEIGEAVVEHASECGRAHVVGAHDYLRIEDPFQAPGLGPHALRIETPGRTVRVEVLFRGEGRDVEAFVTSKGELTPDECAAMTAWCRSRWRAPARVAAITFRVQ